MILFYKNTINNPSAMISMTGLTKSEFDALLPAFEQAYEDYMKETYINDKGRKRASGGGRKPKLQTSEERLFFILYYLKIYPLQQEIAIHFGLSLGQTNFWIHRLSKVLKMALGKGAYLPERNPDASEDALKKCPSLSFVIDGTERRIQRPKDPDIQKEYYSGKKKGHTVKNNIIGDAATKKVVCLSDTYEGKTHDKKIADEENTTYPEGSILYKDSGFQGYEPDNTTCYQPKKKPSGKQLPPEDRIFNTMISGVRIIAEHIIAGVKRLHIVKDVFRNTKENFSDLVIEIACALHNLRISFRPKNRAIKRIEIVWH